MSAITLTFESFSSRRTGRDLMVAMVLPPKQDRAAVDVQSKGGKQQGIEENPIDQDGKSQFLYSAKTIYLFTRNDLKSIVYPEVAFGIFSALSGPVLTTNPSPRAVDVLARLPQNVIWNWLNLLIFDLANQRLPDSIIEDSINKPWRPIPSGRISANETRRLLLYVVPTVLLVIPQFGGIKETVTMLILTWLYNDLGGADENYVTRNLINALGFICYSSGSTIVAAGYGSWGLSHDAWQWLVIVGAIVFTTLQMQDMADMKGDALRGRRTLPLVHGETIARWSIAVPVVFWSLFCPCYWGVSFWSYLAPVSTGFTLAARVLIYRNVDSDRQTWKLWCVWTETLYLLPLCKNLQAIRLLDIEAGIGIGQYFNGL